MGDNHPYHMHREQQVAHRRVDKVLSGSPAGAKQHAQGSAFSKITSKSAAVRSDDVAGKSAPKRFARGGKVSKGGHHTNIAIVVPGAKGAVPPGGPMGAPPPMAGPGGPPPPMAGMPGLPPGAPGMPMRPPGLPMRARGGKVRAGASTGVGREEEARDIRRKQK